MKTILVADDEPALRLLVSTIIESDQYRILEASNGTEAWDLIRKHRPSVALLDIAMPGSTGLELAHSIKHDADLANTRVIILSAKAQEADRSIGFSAGADFYLTKPFSPVDLLNVLERALKLSSETPAASEGTGN